jgi:hypothetical protein
MNLQSVKQGMIRAKWGVGIFLAVFGTLWLLAEPMGIKPGAPLFAYLTAGASVGTIVWILGSMLCKARIEISAKEKELSALRDEHREAVARRSYCCVVRRETAICPLGVTRIHNEMQDTLRSSIIDAKHHFRWLGLSAFNVVHNNVGLFEQQRQVKFEFVTVAPENNSLIREIDKYYFDIPGTLRSGELIKNSNVILGEIQNNVHPNVTVKHYNQMPTFRIILIDDSKALVSFYERGIDALRTPQIEISENPEAEYCILKWFQMLYEKVLITERNIRPA